ncbi:unnamed protein product, partial [Ectocarpus sp. 12 AP-2014]
YPSIEYASVVSPISVFSSSSSAVSCYYPTAVVYSYCPFFSRWIQCRIAATAKRFSVPRDKTTHPPFALSHCSCPVVFSPSFLGNHVFAACHGTGKTQTLPDYVIKMSFIKWDGT